MSLMKKPRCNDRKMDTVQCSGKDMDFVVW